MTTTKSRPTRQIPAMAVSEGAGVTVHRTIGTPALRNYDPFMLLDHFSSDDPDDYIAGFPSHPHRGFNTFTYMLDGFMEHQDSMGNTGNLSPGAAQWMKAASGIIHSEMPKQEHGLMRGFQLWVNLPATNKMDDPEYQEFSPAAFPVAVHENYQVKVLIGRYGELNAPIVDAITDVSYFDVTVSPGKQFSLELNKSYNSLIYVFEGNGQLNGNTVPEHTLIAAGTDMDQLEFIAGDQGARFIFISGRPIDEPIVQYGPFVMNSREEIEQAMHDFQTNNFVKTRAWMKKDQVK